MNDSHADMGEKGNLSKSLKFFLPQDNYTQRGNSNESPEIEITPSVPQDDHQYVEYGAFLIGVLGLVTNGLVLYILGRKNLRHRIRNMFVIHQSFVDFISSILFIMCYASKSVPNKEFEGMGGKVLCLLLDSEGPLWLFLCLSTSSLMLITIERYLIIVKPMVYRNTVNKRWVRMAIAIAWFLTTALLGIPLFYTSGVKDKKCYTVGLWPNTELEKIFCVFYICVTFIVPVGMFVICYLHMFVVMRRRSELLAKSNFSLDRRTGLEVSIKKKSPIGPKLTRNQVNLTKTMVIVSVCFAACWGPSNVHYLLTTFHLISGFTLSGPLYRYLTYLVFLNSCINPVIYAFKYEDFRTEMRRLVRRIKRRSEIVTVVDTAFNIEVDLSKCSSDNDTLSMPKSNSNEVPLPLDDKLTDSK